MKKKPSTRKLGQQSPALSRAEEIRMLEDALRSSDDTIRYLKERLEGACREIDLLRLDTKPGRLKRVIAKLVRARFVREDDTVVLEVRIVERAYRRNFRELESAVLDNVKILLLLPEPKKAKGKVSRRGKTVKR